MADPALVSPSDLEMYLGEPVGSLDVERATFVLSMAQDLCQTIVAPLPPAARVVVLAVATRAWLNVGSAAQLGLGSASVSFSTPGAGGAIGGMYLSRADKAALRSLAGRGAAFAADTLPRGVDAVFTVTVTATAGTFTLAFGGSVSAPVAFNATPAAVGAALAAMASIGPGNVTVTGAVGAYVVTFTGRLGTWPLPPLTASNVGLTGTVAVTATVDGVAKPGQDLPPWDFDYTAAGYRGAWQQFYGDSW